MLEWETITLRDGTAIGGGNGRVEERMRFLGERLAEFRRLRGR
jgi:hypothetical protein